MSAAASFQHFEAELGRLVSIFEKNLAHYKGPGYDEANTRTEFITPFFAALGWDMENKAGLIPAHREVIVESRTGTHRADYLFRTHRRPRFICEAKKPAEELPGHAHQAKRDAWTIGVPLAVLTDFEELHLYIVGGPPKEDEPRAGLWKTYSFRDYATRAHELWDLLARDHVAGGVIDRTVQALPKKPLKIGKNQWVIRPDPTRSFDHVFLTFLDGQRRSLASDLLRHNERENWEEGTRLNEAVQCILDRLLFIRISEARGIDMGTRLESLLDTWKKHQPQGAMPVREEPPASWGGSGLTAPRGSLWNSIVRHIRALDRRPPSHVPFFNGNLFKPHFSEEIVVGDGWLAEFLDKICKDTEGYNFGYVAVEILGTIYERFLGKVVRPHGRGAVIEEKPEVRKAGGVYYTPRYIVEYIVEQTVGKVLEGKKPEESLKLRFLDPACGSGSFLLRVFERVCEHWEQWLTDHPDQRKKDWCWLEKETNTVHLTARLKRRILRETVYGVDLDPQAVEVTQLSLYLKMLEGETTATLEREQDLFGGDEAILPPLQDNIKCGNSLIASDFSMMPEDLVRVHAFDWSVQFAAIMKAGGFDAVVGNPPYRMLQPHNTEPEELTYLKEHYVAAEFKIELFHLFLQRGVTLLKSSGYHGHIVPTTLLNNVYAESLRRWLMERCALQNISVAQGRVFEDADVHTSVVIFRSETDAKARAENGVRTTSELSAAFAAAPARFGRTKQRRFQDLPGATWNILLNETNAPLIERLTSKCATLKTIGTINRGLVTGDRAKYFSPRKTLASHVPILTGTDVNRYAVQAPAEFVRFERPDKAGGCWDREVHLAAHKIVIRQIGTEPTATLLAEPFAVTANIFTVRAASLTDEKYLLAIINSKLTAYFWRTMFADFKASFPQVTIFSLAQVPVRKIDFTKPADKTRHDKLVLLVDKLLLLMPRLRAATGTGEKATLQNAVTATDQQIDALVYDLYGLTPEEIALVEGGQK